MYTCSLQAQRCKNQNRADAVNKYFAQEQRARLAPPIECIAMNEPNYLQLIDDDYKQFLIENTQTTSDAAQTTAGTHANEVA
jgi:hypothetical protein